MEDQQKPNFTKKCIYCGQEIEFVRDKITGKKLPVDPGAIKVVTYSGQVIKAFIPHWPHCSKPDRPNGTMPREAREQLENDLAGTPLRNSYI